MSLAKIEVRLWFEDPDGPPDETSQAFASGPSDYATGRDGARGDATEAMVAFIRAHTDGDCPCQEKEAKL